MAAISQTQLKKVQPLSSSSQYVKKATKLIAPVIFLFVLLQHSAYVFPLILEFFSTVVDKNYMFILCNGILVLIAKSSGLIGSGERKRKVDEFKPEMGGKEKELEEVTEEEVIAEGGKEKEEGKDCSFIAEEVVAEGERGEKEDKDSRFMTDEVEGCDDEEHRDEDLFDEVEEGEEEEGNGLLSDEELQRKCEDFIRKMKAGIKFEAQQHQQQQQQQLIMVQ